MSQVQPTIYTSQPSTNNLPIDTTALLRHGDSTTAVILAIAVLLWIIRPVMLQRESKPESSEKKPGYSNIFGLALLLWILRPLMLQQNSVSSNKSQKK